MIDAFLRFCHRMERRVSSSALAAFAGLLFLAGVVGVANGAGADLDPLSAPTTTSSSTSSSTTVTTTIATRTPIEGFGTANFTVTPAGGPPEPHCGLLADNNDTRAKGLMNEENLRGYDAMLFVFPEDVSASFYMANVKVPLSVAWFDGNGNFVSAADMEICNVAADACPRYGALGPYRYAMETAKGGLDALHVGGGSVLTIGGSGGCG